MRCRIEVNPNGTNRGAHITQNTIMADMWRAVGRAPRVTRCGYGYGICVSLKHGLVVVSDFHAMQLYVYSLVDGTLVRIIGGKNAHGESQFIFSMCGLCITPGGDTVLVPEYHRDRLQEVRVVGAEDHFLRFIGEGTLDKPQFVDCNDKVIVVAEWCHRISVLSWITGCLVAHIGREDSPKTPLLPYGLRLLDNGNELVVVDCGTDQLCVFRLSGELVHVMDAKAQATAPQDILQCSGGFIVSYIASQSGMLLVRMSRDGAVVEVHGAIHDVVLNFHYREFMSALPDGGLVVRETGCARYSVFLGLDLRVAWMQLCCVGVR